MADLIVVRGATDGTSTTGQFTLTSDKFTNSVEYIKIPKGHKCKLWAFEIAGEACDAIFQVSKDGGSNWIDLKRFKLASAGELNIERKARPIVVRAENGNTQVRFSWSQSTAASTYLEATLEIEQE